MGMLVISPEQVLTQELPHMSEGLYPLSRHERMKERASITINTAASLTYALQVLLAVNSVLFLLSL